MMKWSSDCQELIDLCEVCLGESLIDLTLKASVPRMRIAEESLKGVR